MLTFADFIANARTGKLFSVKFIKRSNGAVRSMTARLGVARNINGKGMSYNAVDYNLLTVWDMQKGAYRSISLDSILEIKMAGKTYRPRVTAVIETVKVVRTGVVMAEVRA